MSGKHSNMRARPSFMPRAAVLCSEALDKLIWGNVKWQAMTTLQFTHVSVQDLQVRTNPVVPSRKLKSSCFLLRPVIHLPPLRVQMYVSCNLHYGVDG